MGSNASLSTSSGAWEQVDSGDSAEPYVVEEHEVMEKSVRDCLAHFSHVHQIQFIAKKVNHHPDIDGSLIEIHGGKEGIIHHEHSASLDISSKALLKHHVIARLEHLQQEAETLTSHERLHLWNGHKNVFSEASSLRRKIERKDLAQNEQHLTDEAGSNSVNHRKIAITSYNRDITQNSVKKPQATEMDEESAHPTTDSDFHILEFILTSFVENIIDSSLGMRSNTNRLEFAPRTNAITIGSKWPKVPKFDADPYIVAKQNVMVWNYAGSRRVFRRRKNEIRVGLKYLQGLERKGVLEKPLARPVPRRRKIMRYMT